MLSMFRSRPLSLAILLAVAPLSASAAERADLLIRNATVVDVEHASTPAAGRAERGDPWRGHRRRRSGRAAAQPWSAARQIDAKGKYLIPGLWDMHVHFGGGPALIEENKALLPLYIAHGITTVRDCSGDLPEQVLQWRGEIAKGTLFGRACSVPARRSKASSRSGRARSKSAARPTSTRRSPACSTTRSIS
jgi:predicted amidohydrolase YtcJ